MTYRSRIAFPVFTEAGVSDLTQLHFSLSLRSASRSGGSNTPLRSVQPFNQSAAPPSDPFWRAFPSFVSEPPGSIRGKSGKCTGKRIICTIYPDLLPSSESITRISSDHKATATLRRFPLLSFETAVMISDWNSCWRNLSRVRDSHGAPHANCGPPGLFRPGATAAGRGCEMDLVW